MKEKIDLLRKRIENGQSIGDTISQLLEIARDTSLATQAFIIMLEYHHYIRPTNNVIAVITTPLILNAAQRQRILSLILNLLDELEEYYLEKSSSKPVKRILINWQIQITYFDDEIIASKALHLMWVFSAVLTQIDNVEVRLVDWGRGSFWINFKVIFKTKKAKNQTIQLLEDLRNDPNLPTLYEENKQAAPLTERFTKLADKGWVKDAGAGLANKIYGKEHANTRKLKEEAKNLEVQREKLKQETELHPLNKKEQELKLAQMELELKDKQLAIREREIAIENKELDLQERKQNLAHDKKMKAIEVKEAKARMFGNLPEFLKQGLVEQTEDFEVAINDCLFVKKDGKKLIAGVDMKTIDENGKNNEDKV